jgi:hypothetical protein
VLRTLHPDEVMRRAIRAAEQPRLGLEMPSGYCRAHPVTRLIAQTGADLHVKDIGYGLHSFWFF